MIIQCAWCKELIGKKEPLHDTRISHSICEVCEKKLLAKYVSKEVKHEAA